MSFIDSAIGLILLILAAGLLFVFALPRRNRSPRPLRPISAFQQLQRAIGLAVEEGKGLHVTIGEASINSSNAPSALVGLRTLERIAELSMISDRPPVATSGDGTLAILSQDTLRAAYRAGNAIDQFDPDRGRLGGITPFSYVAGVLPLVHNPDVAAHIVVGNFGPEVALISEAASQEESFCMAASDALPAQAVLYATAQEPLIGEELFAIPAYIQAGPVYSASLRVQDILRWVIIVLLLGGAVLKILGIPIL